ncbi:universal stress protein [Saccharopolyspora phatthalungensis]|uniref:Nucleotide-binding universal stress UspA family protein n=1 Tax=Saccharopolyspora phatthalungensis TaxID=664693 RepID=A0A840Q6G1_9PSEU|nr:universal stress protein [Saccharopolyspora phatthalungensis]MBB5156056.1 nucleotide-binding universal stress UspA family protein [Saccharopolyspora phatthalungensis]
MVRESHAALGAADDVPRVGPYHARERQWQDLNHLVRDCLGEESTPKVDVELVEGDAAEVLAEKSAHAAVLILGDRDRDRGRGRVADAVLGSTALRCTHKAQCPVLVILMGMRPAETEPIEQVLVIDRVLG